MTAINFYDNPGAERYAILGGTFSAIFNRTFQGPPGRKGFVRDIVLCVTTTIVGTTSVPEIRVGSVLSDNSFARFMLGTTAVAGYAAGSVRARSLCQNAQGRTGGNAAMLNDFAGHICLEGNNGLGSVAIPVTATDAGVGLNFLQIPADTAFFITGVAAVGAAAGVADIYVDIDWY